MGNYSDCHRNTVYLIIYVKQAFFAKLYWYPCKWNWCQVFNQIYKKWSQMKKILNISVHLVRCQHYQISQLLCVRSVVKGSPSRAVCCSTKLLTAQSPDLCAIKEHATRISKTKAIWLAMWERMLTSGISVPIVRTKTKIKETATCTHVYMRMKGRSVTTVKNVESVCVLVHKWSVTVKQAATCRPSMCKQDPLLRDFFFL